MKLRKAYYIREKSGQLFIGDEHPFRLLLGSYAKDDLHSAGECCLYDLRLMAIQVEPVTNPFNIGVDRSSDQEAIEDFLRRRPLG